MGVSFQGGKGGGDRSKERQGRDFKEKYLSFEDKKIRKPWGILSRSPFGVLQRRNRI